jgi:hypothetical protein
MALFEFFLIPILHFTPLDPTTAIFVAIQTTKIPTEFFMNLFVGRRLLSEIGRASPATIK